MKSGLRSFSRPPVALAAVLIALTAPLTATAVDLFDSGTANTITPASATPPPASASLPRPGPVDNYVVTYAGGTYWLHSYGTNLLRSVDGERWERLEIDPLQGQRMAVGGTPESGLLLGDGAAFRIENGVLQPLEGHVRLEGAPNREGTDQSLFRLGDTYRVFPFRDGYLLTTGSQCFLSPDGLRWEAGRWSALLEGELGDRFLDQVVIRNQILAMGSDARLYHSEDGNHWGRFPGVDPGPSLSADFGGVAAGNDRLVVFSGGASEDANRVAVYGPDRSWTPVKLANALAIPVAIAYSEGRFALAVRGFRGVNDFTDRVGAMDDIDGLVVERLNIYTSSDGSQWNLDTSLSGSLQIDNNLVRKDASVPFRSFAGVPGGTMAFLQSGTMEFVRHSSEKTPSTPPALPGVKTVSRAVQPTIDITASEENARAAAETLQAKALSGDAEAAYQLADALAPEFARTADALTAFRTNPLVALELAEKALASGNGKAATLLARLLEGWLPSRHSEIESILSPHLGVAPEVAYEIGLAKMRRGNQDGLALLQRAAGANPAYEPAIDAIDYFTRLEDADAGDPEALYAVGTAILRDREAKRLPVTGRGEQYLLKAARAGHPQALNYVVDRLKDPGALASTYTPILHQLANAGNVTALRMRGYLLLTGEIRAIGENFTLGKQDMEAAAAAGDAEAMEYLGTLYARGGNIPADPETAKTWYEKAVAGGREEAAEALANIERRLNRSAADKRPLDGRVEGVSQKVYDALDPIQRNQRMDANAVRNLFIAVWSDARYGGIEEDLAQELLLAGSESPLTITDSNGRSLQFKVAVPASMKIDFERLFPKVLPIDDSDFIQTTWSFAETGGAVLLLAQEGVAAGFETSFREELGRQMRTHSTTDATMINFLDAMNRRINNMDEEPAARFRSLVQESISPVLESHAKAVHYVYLARERDLFTGEITHMEATWNALIKAGDPFYGSLLESRRKSFTYGSFVNTYLMEYFLEFWAESNVANAYSPLRDAISNAFVEINEMNEEDQTETRTMIHRALSFADLAVDDAIPDFLYNWVAPAGQP